MMNAGKAIEGNEEMRAIGGMGSACKVGERTDEKHAADATSIRLGIKGGGSHGSDGSSDDSDGGSAVFEWFGWFDRRDRTRDLGAASRVSRGDDGESACKVRARVRARAITPIPPDPTRPNPTRPDPI